MLQGTELWGDRRVCVRIRVEGLLVHRSTVGGEDFGRFAVHVGVF